jgi:NAD(P)H-hydrate epimerase
MIVSCDEMRALEHAAFAAGTTAAELMADAAEQMAHAVRQFFPRPGTAIVFYGKGHNGGDALAAAKHLVHAGWHIMLRPQENDANRLSALTREHLFALGPTDKRAQMHAPIILDGLLGIGGRGPLRDDLRVLTREINALRQSHHAHVFSVDLPTGLNGDSGEADPDCVVADFTLTIGFPKRGLLVDQAANFVGRIALLPLAKLEAAPVGGEDAATPISLAALLPPRRFETHKTQQGRIGIVAGSPGFTGAAQLTAQGALRGGAGLVTLYATPDVQPILAGAAGPEIMVKRDVLAIGPGLGTARGEEVLELIERCECPMIIDADALNILAQSKKMELLKRCAGPRLLTPHPGEMARLFDIGGRSRAETVRAFTDEFPVTLLFKGSRTLVGEKGKPLSHNTTGSPGMATGGMGDALTGVCAALAGQGLSLFDSARLGSWLCGRAAELAIFHGPESEQSLAAMDVPEHLGLAFKQLFAGCL